MAHRTLTYPIRGDKLQMSVRVEQTLCDIQTKFQRVEIIDTIAFGRMLLLDGHVQLSELDEHAYHESLVAWPLLGLESPKSALVVGGGDGGVLREICRFPSIERIDMVEIDEGVIGACREHLPGLSAGAFDDPRLHLTIGDAFEFVKTAQGRYDLIIADATDVYEGEEGNLSEQLFTEGFYRDLGKLLSDQGMVVTQADNHLFCPYSLEGALDSFQPVFSRVGAWWAMVPSFGGYSAFAYGSFGSRPAQSMPAGAPTGLHYLNDTTIALGLAPLRF